MSCAFYTQMTNYKRQTRSWLCWWKR